MIAREREEAVPVSELSPPLEPPRPAAPPLGRSRLLRAAPQFAIYALLVTLSAVFLLPFLWMVSSSFKTLQTIFEYPPSPLPMETVTDRTADGRRVKVALYRASLAAPPRRVGLLDRRKGEYLIETIDQGDPVRRWVPEDRVQPRRRVAFHTENYAIAWTAKPFTQYVLNTLFITVLAILGQVISASLVGFAFARLKWPGRDLFFILLLATMMLPYEATLIPNYLIYRWLGWIDTYLPLIVPSFLGGGAFYIFLFRQFFLSLPREMDEAARVDGCSTFGIYRQILMPLCKPIIATTAVLSFVHHWNDFLPPMIYLNSSDKFTIAIGLRFFMGVYETDLHLMMAAATLALIPVVLVFLFGQRYFIKSIVLSGTKG